MSSCLDIFYLQTKLQITAHIFADKTDCLIATRKFICDHYGLETMKVITSEENRVSALQCSQCIILQNDKSEYIIFDGQNFTVVVLENMKVFYYVLQNNLYLQLILKNQLLASMLYYSMHWEYFAIV